MKWITRAHVHVDRVACPWLIKRFVDAEAEFIFVARDLVDAEANRLGAIPFDAPGVELGHQEGHCSFVSIVRKYNLRDPALLKLADVVDAADTGKMDQNPYATGLEAIAQGHSVLYPDDHTNVERQLSVYDALYAYFKLHGSK
jgi:hypothetical protein